MHNDISEILFSEQDLAIRVRELGEAITRDYADVAGDAGIVVVSILRGGAVFTCDLIRAIDLPLEVDFMAVSSYGNGAKSSGVVRILKDLSTDIRGRHVVIAEDIIDSGLTLKYLLKNLQSREPASLTVAALMRKNTPAPGRPSRAAMSASSAPTSSSSVTASTLPSITATSPTSAF